MIEVTNKKTKSMMSLAVRVHPTVKEGLRVVTEMERRSLASMVEEMILDYSARSGVAISPLGKERQ